MSDAHLPRLMISGVEAVLSHAFSLPSVQVFIVISGYCLMLPVARAEGRVSGGFSVFVRRRATRILPPYFAMLALAISIVWFMNQATLIDPPIDDIHWAPILSHVFLVHNWHEGYNHALDPPMWSIAVEWQIYFLFPLLLLPLWRRWGMAAATVGAFVLGLAPHFLGHGYLDWSCPWFLGLFALGMAAADLNLPQAARIRPALQRWPWGRISAALWLLFVASTTLASGRVPHFRLIADPLVGVATLCLLVSTTRAVLEEGAPREHLGLRFFGSRPLTWLGAFSYSIYLTHYPLMMLFFYSTLKIQMSVFARGLLMFGVFLPLSILFAYVFYLVFERPFILHLPKSKPAPAVLATESPR
jgi:peptidoglycan/LPS O-acetylase OafA/YrhL